MKNALLVMVAVLNSYCGPRAVQTPDTTITGNEEVVTELPPRPDVEPIAPEDDWVVAVSVGEMVDQPGVCMSDAKALRAGRYVVSYNELRALYRSDLRTWNRERDIYERYLTEAEMEMSHWREKSRRSWWERNSGQIGLAAGIVIGAGLAVGLVYGINQVAE
jgi:hypothetical protein